MRVFTLAVILFMGFTSNFNAKAQAPFSYELSIHPIQILGLPGLHSFAFGQSGGKCLLIGGRRDGLHARQPNSSFPANQNNTSLYVIDFQTSQFWSAPLSSLPTSIAEQLQSTNMNFFQDKDTLYIIGGYAFSATANDHITFDKLTSVQVSSVINAIINNQSFSSFFKQVADPIFANSGGQLGKLGNTFYLVGGQRFDGRYNPMNNPTYTQTYYSQYTKLLLSNSVATPNFTIVQTITDPVHLRRRDYNLLPQIFPDGSEGYMISSGVFQINADLPFLYPVDISPTGYIPRTNFNQYLSNYHGAKVALWDSTFKSMHNLFFGGMSQHYYQNGTQVQDNSVPFVKTISRVTRNQDSSLQEFKLNTEMPGYLGAGAEFIPNQALPHTENEIIKLHQIQVDSFTLGYVVGGIISPTTNPFTGNQSNTTSANTVVYEVRLQKAKTNSVNELIDGKNPYSIFVYPNPAEHECSVTIESPRDARCDYFLVNMEGKILSVKNAIQLNQGKNNIELELPTGVRNQQISLSIVIDGIYFITEKITIK